MLIKKRQGKFPGKNTLACPYALLLGMLAVGVALTASPALQAQAPPAETNLAQNAAPSIDPFYTRLLRDGIRAGARGAHGEAARLLELACFGFLDDPKVLTEGLAHLALAQAALQDAPGIQATFDRLALLEERFGAYSSAPLTPDLQQRLAELWPRFVNPAVLQDSPGFQAPPLSPVLPEEPLQNDLATTPEPFSLTQDEIDQLQQARALMGKARTAGDLVEPLALAREIADGNPEASEAQHLTAEIAYRASRWQEAARYFRRGGDPGDEQPALLFFMAVSLFESGDRDAAAALLRRALPRMQRTPYVSTYAERILGDVKDLP
jgi:tetratricopeptide (TPR) repeat protein